MSEPAEVLSMIQAGDWAYAIDYAVDEEKKAVVVLRIEHATGTTVLLWLVIAHVLAVVVHQVWWRTDILRRMT